MSSQDEVTEQGNQAAPEVVLEAGVQNYLDNGDNTSFSAEGQEETGHIEQNLQQLDDPVEQEEDDDVDMLVSIDEAKSLVELIEKKSRKRKALSHVWKVIKVVRIRDLNLFDDLQRLDSQAHQKLFGANNEGKDMCVCEPCYNESTTPLHKCLISPSYTKAGKIDGTGNMTKHLNSKHSGLLASLAKAPSNRDPSNNNSTPAKNSSNSVDCAHTPVTEAAASATSLPSTCHFRDFNQSHGLQSIHSHCANE